MILLILGFFVFICRASRISSRSLLISCVIIVVFSSRIFRNLDLGIEWALRCKAMEQESLRCIVSRLERVVVVRPTYALFSLETQTVMTDLSPPHMKKPSNINPCPLNFQSECLFCYKRTIIKRAKLLSSSWTIFLNKLRNINQTLINNGFPNYIVDTKIKQFINKPEQHNIDNNLNNKQSINLNYKKRFHSNYKIDEHILKNLIEKMFSLRTLPKRLNLFYTTRNLKPPT